MSDKPKIVADELTPILFVRDFEEAMDYYTKKLLFDRLWDWGTPPDFGAVRLGKIEIFFCLKGQGSPGAWLSIFMEDVDSYHDQIRALGADILEPPANMPWGMREMQVRDPNGHIIRFGHGVPAREPKMLVERVPFQVRLEKRLAALLQDLANHKSMTLGEVLEETFLHTFELMPDGNVASPHTRHTHNYIAELRKKHGLDYDCHATYRFTESQPAT